MGAIGHAWLLATLLAAAAPLQATLRIDVDPAGLALAELEASHALVSRTRELLPATFEHDLDTTVVLRWRDDLPHAVHGRAHGGRIGLRRSLLDGWLRRDPAAGDADPDARVALAALLHELAHVHDRSPRGGLSREPRLLDLAGWPVQPLRLGLRTSRNDLRDRTPDAYELASPAEFVAVNFEHFLLDPGYACARPALYRHFADRFGLPPARGATTGCPRQLPFVAAGQGGAMLQGLELDPSRIHSVDYLFAEASEQPMSRWGHAMLRLVVCAPGRPRGPECRLDLQHHLVLSFRAFVDDVQVSSWRGLTGSYPSRLFVLPLEQVVDEYTRVELRGLQSIPLRLDDGEVAGLLERAAQMHWSYDGRYRFIDNNCAVETWKLLNDGVPRLSQTRLRSITPTGLLRRLEREGIADMSALDDAARALREGYRFASMGEHFDAMFAIADAALGLPAADARAWFALDPELRTPFLERGDLRATAALLVLEEAAMQREQAQAREALKQRILRGDGASGEAAERLRQLFADGAWAGRPSLLLGAAGYGLPRANERASLAGLLERDDARLRALRDALHLQAREWLPPAQLARLEGTERNLERLGERLRTVQDVAMSDH
ncbi:DUF7844 domain-containing protein [Luteimonas sp. A482]